MLLKLFVDQVIVRGKTGKVLLALLGLWGAKGVVNRIRVWLKSRRFDRERQDFRDQCQQMLTDLEDKVTASKVNK